MKNKSIGNREILRFYEEEKYNDMVELIDELKERFKSNGLNSENVWNDFFSFLELLKFDGILYPDCINDTYDGVIRVYDKIKNK